MNQMKINFLQCKTLISKFGYKINLRDKKDISKSLNQLMSDVNGKKEQNIVDTLSDSNYE